MNRTTFQLVLIAAMLAGTQLLAQQVRVAAPVAGAVIATATQQDDPDEDVGVNVEMFENPNLDRYLRKAQSFLGREDYNAAIKVLQDVIEGRTSVAIGEEPEGPEKPDGGAPEKVPEKASEKTDTNTEAAAKPTTPTPKAVLQTGSKAAGASGEQPGQSMSAQLLDPSRAVFSPDGRLFRPVRRLCQEMLAMLPPGGLSLYETSYEVPAAELLDQAIAEGSTAALERVVDHYFVTPAAGRAMVLLADRLMSAGRYRAAVQVLRDLTTVYPKAYRQKLGVNEVWCQFKIALCMRLGGDIDAAREIAVAMAQRWPDESLRVAGELQPVKDLPQNALFGHGASELQVDGRVTAAARPFWLREGLRQLVPLWQYRFAEPKPYVQTPKRNNDNIWMEGVLTNAAPFAFRYGVGARVCFRGGGEVPDRAVFLDNNRLEVAQAFTGLLRQEGDGNDMPARPRDNQPRARVPVYDWANMRPIEDETRYFVLLGYQGTTNTNLAPLKDNTLVAYDKATLKREWSSSDWLAGPDGLEGVTFLASATVHGPHLLVPVLRDNAYAVQCLDRATGRPLWRTPVHMGGSPFFKAPGAPIQVQGGIAYMLTNAGGLAAVDAFGGELRWVRKYERRDPTRPPVRVSRARAQQRRMPFGNRSQFTELEMPSFLPSELICSGGLLIAAPCDSYVLLCLDGASGEIVWLIDQDPGLFADYGKLQYVVGANSRYAYVATKSDLICIGLRSGVRLWSRSMPVDGAGAEDWRGRGVVMEDVVLMPNGREVLAYDAEGRDDPQRIELPTFADGPEPAHGACNLTVSGPWLGVAYEGVVEVFSSVPALHDLAEASSDPQQRAAYLVQAGDAEGAVGVLEAWLDKAELTPERQAEATARMLNVARERALQLGPSDPKAALRLLDRVRVHIHDRTVRMDWHVARLDLFKEIQDLRAYEEEQQRLYRFMEGKD